MTMKETDSNQKKILQEDLLDLMCIYLIGAPVAIMLIFISSFMDFSHLY